MILYKSHEVIKLTGTTAAKLKYMDDYGKLIPYKRSASTRYYTEEQVIEIMQYMNKAVEAAYVCVEYTNNVNTNPNIDKINSLLKSKELQMKDCIKNHNISKDILFVSDILVNRNIKDSNLEMLSKKAILGKVKRIYVDTEIGFPTDLINEYIKWLNYVNVEFIDLVRLRREKSKEAEVPSNK